MDDREPPTRRLSFSELSIKRKKKIRRLHRRREKLKRVLRSESLGNRAAYEKYIESPRWKGLKIMIVAERGSACERCGKPGPVDMHHVDYAPGSGPETVVTFLSTEPKERRADADQGANGTPANMEQAGYSEPVTAAGEGATIVAAKEALPNGRPSVV
jgi:hypothetical protein